MRSGLKWIEKVLQIGAKVVSRTHCIKPRKALSTDGSQIWRVPNPQQFGYAVELSTGRALARPVRQHAVQAGYPAFSKAAQRIPDALRPKVTYYLERRYPNFLSNEGGCRRLATSRRKNT
jgi:hypothetical protein